MAFRSAPTTDEAIAHAVAIVNDMPDRFITRQDCERTLTRLVAAVTGVHYARQTELARADVDQILVAAHANLDGPRP